MRQQLILITGTRSIGKTTTAESLFNMLNNSAHLDGDWLWNVNPFSLEDPRLRNGDKSMSFALSTYLKSAFDYVIFSSCKGSITEPAYDWLKFKPHPNDIVINTDDKDIEEVSKEIYACIIERRPRA